MIVKMPALPFTLCVMLLLQCNLGRSVPQGQGPPGGAGAGGGMARPTVIASRPPLAPGIRPEIFCSDDGENSFLNDSCKSDADCVGSGSMVCTKSRCQCAPGYIEDPSEPAGTKQRVCVPLPSLFSACKDKCQKPYECKSGAGPMGTDMMPPGQQWSGKTCQCPGESKYSNGFCDNGCKSGQRVGTGGTCVDRCSKDQVFLDGECKKLSGLSESCTDNGQCRVAFSTCSNGKCQCMTGFSASGSTCKAKSYSCPLGDPLQKGGSVVQCTSSFGGFVMPPCRGSVCPMMGAAAGAGMGMAPQAMGGANAAKGAGEGAPVGMSASMPIMARPHHIDTCPSGHYCHNYDPSSGKANGHCCPKPPAKCPAGDVHPNGKCDGGTPSCPYTTHTCVTVGDQGPFGASALCCPKPCAGYDRVYVKDQCLPLVQYGDACQADEQCQQANGVCTDGKCSCPSKATVVQTGGPNKYCQMNCGSDEVLFGNECKAKLKLGDSCTDSILCPSGAYCNSKGVCACPCGYRKLNDHFCAPRPSCPGPNGMASSNFGASQKVTFCKLDGDAKPPFTAADTCPSKFYCSGYVENMGVCCPQPDPFCPDGSKPSSKTNCHQSGKGCGDNNMCNIYFSSVTSGRSGAVQQGSVCCPQPAAPGGVGGAPAGVAVDAAAAAGPSKKGK